MKALLFSFFSILLLTYSINISAQCTQSIKLHTQAEVDAFALDYACSLIEGNLTIGSMESDSPSDIKNLKALECITSVKGSLEIIKLDSLSTLDGLQNIKSIGRNLEITYNNQLNNLDGLKNLKTVGRELMITYNNQLNNLDGLQNLKAVGDDLMIWHNSKLTNLNGLQNLTTVGKRIGITKNNKLSNLNGLQNITTVGRGISLTSNENLSNLEAIQNITTFEYLSIKGNKSLETCRSILSMIETVIAGGGYIFMSNNSPQCNFTYKNAPNDNSVKTFLDFYAASQIQTIAFFDENDNGIFDTNEQSIQQFFKLSPSPLFSDTQTEDAVSFYLDSRGQYELSLNNTNPLWEFSGTKDTIQIDFLDSTFSDTLHYFPMTPIADFTIQSIDFKSHKSHSTSNAITNMGNGTFRCIESETLTNKHYLTLTNEGTTISDGYIELIADDLTHFNSANPPADSTAGNRLYWFYEDLSPTHSKKIQLVYKIESQTGLSREAYFATYDILSYQIQDSSGNPIEESKCNDESVYIELKEQEEEVYFINLETPIGTFIQKLLIH